MLPAMQQAVGETFGQSLACRLMLEVLRSLQTVLCACVNIKA